MFGLFILWLNVLFCVSLNLSNTNLPPWMYDTLLSNVEIPASSFLKLFRCTYCSCGPTNRVGKACHKKFWSNLEGFSIVVIFLYFGIELVDC